MRLPLLASAITVSLASFACPSAARAQPPPAPAPAQTEIPATPPAPPADVTPAIPPPAVPATTSTKPDSTKTMAVELTSLRLLLAKGVISQAEYDAALRDLGETSGMRAGEANTFVLGRWATTLYGFVEGDAIYDSTESLNEIAGNTQIARPGTYAGNADRLQFSIRNSRFGLRLKAPETNGIRAAGQLEMDFFGTQLPFGGTNPGTEAAQYNNSVLRVRHMNLKIETPVLDFLIGQYWVLFGWQAQYLPATVEVQGIPGEIFSRQMQFRISKTVKTQDVTFEAAIAALRPVQRDSAVPVGQGGVRFAVNHWTAPQTLNLTGTSIQPLSVAVTGDLRHVRVPEFSAEPVAKNTETGGSVAVDTFIPVIPGAADSKGNSLALNGEFSTGYGQADLYTSQSGGVANPALPVAAGATVAPTFDPHLDPGIAVYDSQGTLHFVQWTAIVGGIQYYFPGTGNVFMSANYSHAQSANAGSLGGAATAAANAKKTRDAEDWFDVNLFWDVTSAVRLAVEYANFHDRYNDGTYAINHRAQLSGVFLF
jgi:hypothetical protein